MREQFYRVPYNHLIKKLISATFHYQKVKNQKVSLYQIIFKVINSRKKYNFLRK